MTERRADERVSGPALAGVRATLRPGCRVSLVDVSPGGALLEGPRPLHPGSRVHLHVGAGAAGQTLSARVVRCSVWSLDPIEGITYRGAVCFDERPVLAWERHTRAGYPRPVGAEAPGNGLPDRDAAGRR